MTDIQFYHLTSTPLDRALPKLLEKALQGGFKAVVLAASDDAAEALNATLWTYNPASFLPHGTAKDGAAEAQPVYITAKQENPNDAGLLVVTSGAQVRTEGYTRILDMFDGSNDNEVTAARGRWKQYKEDGHTVAYIRQTATGGWEKQA